MTLSDEQITAWREDAEYDGLANGDGGRTPEYTVGARRIIALCDALTDARLNGRIHRRDAHEFAKARDGWHRRAKAAEAKLAHIQEALDRHPKVCDRHTEGDPISCGWKRAVADVATALTDEGGGRDE